jgi:hypothetical protein
MPTNGRWRTKGTATARSCAPHRTRSTLTVMDREMPDLGCFWGMKRGSFSASVASRRPVLAILGRREECHLHGRYVETVEIVFN